MLVLARESALDGGKGLGERKDIRRHQHVCVVRSDRMPIDALGSYRDLRHQVGARHSEALSRSAAQRDAADNPIAFIDPFGIKEATELRNLFIA